MLILMAAPLELFLAALLAYGAYAFLLGVRKVQTDLAKGFWVLCSFAAFVAGLLLASDALFGS
jgi:hypothetical protein